jgi:tetratricopeptide (TPR) repeat protein
MQASVNESTLPQSSPKPQLHQQPEPQQPEPQQAELPPPPPAEARTIFSLDSKAMARLAQKTAVAIAWLLILPDAVALLPSSPDFMSWFIRLLGLWISALVLWYVGFLGILHLVRLAGEGVSTDKDGIRLWRFAKIIAWERVEAVAIEPQEAFSRLFSLKPMAYRLIIFERPRKALKFFSSRLIPHNIPSFLFAPEQFDSLCRTISANAMQTVAQEPNVLLVRPISLNRLRLMYNMMTGQRVFLTLLVAFGLVSLLGRKAFVNYSYNYGNRDLSEHLYLEAKERYKLALALDPPFAAGWYNLAIAEYNLGDFAEAEKHWRKALLYKPDYVEAKVSLAHMFIQERQFKQAQDLLDSALNLATLDPFALVNRADLNMHLGLYSAALADARAALAQDERNPALRYMAACLAAEAKLRLGNASEALKLLSTLGPASATDLHHDENVAFRLSVESLCLSALGQHEKAVALGEDALRRSPKSAHALFGLIDIYFTEGELQAIPKLLSIAKETFPESPYTYLKQCQLAVRERDNRLAHSAFSHLQCMQNQDADSLAQTAELARELGETEQAVALAKRSLAIDPSSRSAQLILLNMRAQ